MYHLEHSAAAAGRHLALPMQSCRHGRRFAHLTANNRAAQTPANIYMSTAVAANSD